MLIGNTHINSKKISPLLGRKQSPNHTEKIRQANLGRTISVESRKKMSVAKTGVTLSEAHKNKISVGNKGKHASPTWLMTTLIGRKVSVESRKKMRLAKLGKKVKENPISSEVEQIRKNDKDKTWAKSVYARDHYTCKKCGVIGKSLNAHHIKSFKVLLRETATSFPELYLYDAANAYPPPLPFMGYF
jgi:hypothetical protein